MSTRRVTVGTRGSALALRQTELIVGLLRHRNPTLQFEIATVQTLSDRNPSVPISEIGDKAVFVQPLAEALLKEEIDLAVHSLKDVPADAEMEDLEISAFSKREDVRDVLVSRNGNSLENLPSGARIGTGSLRRQSQLLRLRPDLIPVPIRGNVDTRLRKLQAGEYEALILAAAGLIRLGLSDRISQYLDASEFVPDAGQGILALQTRRGSAQAELVRAVDDVDSRVAATAERAVVRGLEADCRSPVGAYAQVESDTLVVSAMASSLDLRRVFRAEERGPSSEAENLGLEIGRRLLHELSQ
jgi:hydroxymethylbilane synthase